MSDWKSFFKIFVYVLVQVSMSVCALGASVSLHNPNPSVTLQRVGIWHYKRKCEGAGATIWPPTQPYLSAERRGGETEEGQAWGPLLSRTPTHRWMNCTVSKGCYNVRYWTQTARSARARAMFNVYCKILPFLLSYLCSLQYDSFYKHTVKLLMHWCVQSFTPNIIRCS